MPVSYYLMDWPLYTRQPSVSECGKSHTEMGRGQTALDRRGTVGKIEESTFTYACLLVRVPDKEIKAD